MAGCATSRAPREIPTAVAPPRDAAFSSALAHYADGLMRQNDAGDGAAVRDAFEAARRLDPDSRRPVDAVVLQLLEQKQPAAALDTFERFCRAHPDDFEAARDLARLAELGQDYRRAARACAAACRLRPADPALAAARIRILFADRRDREAVRDMRALAHDIPTADTRNLPLYWAWTLARREHEPERALTSIDLATSLATTTAQRAECRLFYGETALAAGRTNDAAEAFDDALKADPLQVRAGLALGALLHNRDGAPALARQARRAARAPDDLPAWLTLAGLHLAAQDRTNALPALARARVLLRERGLTPPETLYLLEGGMLDDLGRRQEAIALFQEALQSHPRADVLMNYLAYMWALANEHLDEAERLARQAVTQKPRSGAYLDTLGWVRYRQRRFAEALDLLLKAGERLPDDATVLDHIGDTLASLSRVPEATAFWSRSFAADATQAPVADKLRAHGVDPARIPPLPKTPGGNEEDEE